MKVAYSCQVPLGQGFAQVAQQAVNALKERGHDVELFVPHKRNKGISGFDEWHDQYTALHMAQGIDVFCGWANASLECIKRAKIIGAKSVIHRGSAHIMFQEEVLAQEGIHLDPMSVDRQVAEYENADKIIVDSTFIRETFRKFSPHLVDKVHVVNLGVDSGKFTYQPQRQDKFVVLFVGGNYDRKGLWYLLEAWKKLDIKDDMELRVVGGNRIYPYGYNVHFQGYVDDLVSEYHNASILCLPSLEDGWGMVVTEAMACGRPAIISENVGAKDAIINGKNGEIVEVRSCREIMDAIRCFYYNRDELAKQSVEARKTAEQFTWEKYKENFIEVVESCYTTK